MAKIDGALHAIESKAWLPEVIIERLTKSLGGKVSNTGELLEGFSIGGQLQKDLIIAITRAKNGAETGLPKGLWIFDNRVTNEKITEVVDALVKTLEESASVRKGFFDRLNHPTLKTADQIDAFIDSAGNDGLRKIIEDLFGKGLINYPL